MKKTVLGAAFVAALLAAGVLGFLYGVHVGTKQPGSEAVAGPEHVSVQKDSAEEPKAAPPDFELGFGDVLVTKNYLVTITHPCPEGCVSCDNVTYRGMSRKSGKAITLKGSTWHSIGADGVTPSAFRGYQFTNGDTTYMVLVGGVLQVVRGDSEVLVSEKGVWR